MRKQAIERFIRDNADLYVGEERDGDISVLAKEIMKTGVKEKDAYHVACAVFAKCDYFISTDIRLLKYKTSGIRLITPCDFITETEGER